MIDGREAGEVEVEAAPIRMRRERGNVALLLMISVSVTALAVGGGYLLGARGLSYEGTMPPPGQVGTPIASRAELEEISSEVAATRTAIATRAAGATPSSGGLTMGVVQRGAASLGEPAPPFRLASLDEEDPVALSDFLGRPVLVNFWATWCPPCRAEMPYLQAVADRHAKDGLVVLAIDVQESADEVLPFVVSMGLTIPVLLDEDGDVADRYRIKTYPTTYLVDSEGIVSSIKRGAYRRQSDVDGAVQRLLADSVITP